MTDRDIPFATEQKNTLRDKIGKDVPLSKIFTPEAIKDCQELIDTAQQDFFNDAFGYLHALDAEYKQAHMTPDQSHLCLRKMVQLSVQLKSTMEMLGLVFGFEISQMLYSYLRGLKELTPQALTVVCKHMDVLRVVIKQKNKTDNDPIAKDMISGLQQLMKKAC